MEELLVKFPSNCKGEHSKWSYSQKLLSVLIELHNVNCLGMTAQEAINWRKANFRPKQKAVLAEIRKAEDAARLGEHWNPRVPDHAQNGDINYPPELKQVNEGSRAIFLLGLQHEVVKDNFDLSSDNLVAVQDELSIALNDAVNGFFWNPSIEDIVDA